MTWTSSTGEPWSMPGISARRKTAARFWTGFGPWRRRLAKFARYKVQGHPSALWPLQRIFLRGDSGGRAEPGPAMWAAMISWCPGRVSAASPSKSAWGKRSTPSSRSPWTAKPTTGPSGSRMPAPMRCSSRRFGLTARAAGCAWERTPRLGFEVWKRRIEETMAEQRVFTLLCHPINLTVPGEGWGNPLDEFLFPVIELLGELSRQKRALGMHLRPDGGVLPQVSGIVAAGLTGSPEPLAQAPAVLPVQPRVLQAVTDFLSRSTRRTPPACAAPARRWPRGAAACRPRPAPALPWAGRRPRSTVSGCRASRCEVSQPAAWSPAYG